VKIKAGTRDCAVCGQFYPADPGELTSTITALIADVANTGKLEGIKGLIVPHAGYMYSGPTAAHAYALLRQESFSLVVVVSPSHREYFDGISVFPGDAYGTPLGKVPVAVHARERLIQASPAIQESAVGHGDEHAVEVQLPFLQALLGSFEFLPIVVGDQRREYCYALGEALAATFREERVLLVASTDLSHYHSGAVADKLDAVATEDIRTMDFDALMRHLELQQTEACGGGPTVSVMIALHRMGVKQMTILHHSNSGDVTGDYRQVVGYLSAVAHE
jgi:AmmeMemoRadiSam system protein B